MSNNIYDSNEWNGMAFVAACLVVTAAVIYWGAREVIAGDERTKAIKQNQAQYDALKQKKESAEREYRDSLRVWRKKLKESER